jgi:N-formylglutamate amidohydrolase
MQGEAQSGMPAIPKPVETVPAFDRYGRSEPRGPVVVSVPHAGRDYPPVLAARARTDAKILQRLEDRHADRLADRVIADGHSVIVARVARAMIDLNRDEREIEPATEKGVPHGFTMTASGKVRGGLGLLPRRLQGVGELWTGPFDWAEVAKRIESLHRPYHAALAEMMRRARATHGRAILLDVHSMPPLTPDTGRKTPRIVLGDRFGRSASSRLVADVADICAGAGLAVAQNHPYAGDYLIARHGRPERNLHALQIEVDRSLYLDAVLDRPGPGLAAMQALLARIVDAVGDALPGADFAQAAE